jgi:DNA-binding response OmpR family regulator
MTEKRLLVVDDQPELGEAVRHVAVEMGYDVLVMTHGKDFMQAFEVFQPTTVMVDIIMPDIDGIELVNWLYDRGCEAKVLVASASHPEYAILAKSIGDAKGLNITSIEKPFKTATLRAALRDTIPC